MNNFKRFLLILIPMAILFMFIIKIQDGQYAFIVSGIAVSYVARDINNYIQRRKLK